MKATSKYSLTEAHRSSIFLDVPFLTPFSINVAFLIDIAETNNEDLAFDVLLKTRRVTISQMHHIVHLKRAQTSSDAAWGWGYMKKHKKCIYPKSVLFIIINAQRRKTWSLSCSCAHNLTQHRSRSLHNAHEQQAPHTGARSHWLRGGERPMTPIKRRD